MADLEPVVVDGRKLIVGDVENVIRESNGTARLFVDGEEFPYGIAKDSVHVDRQTGAAYVTLTIIARSYSERIVKSEVDDG